MARWCSVDDCARTHYARGLCGMHYRRVRRHGDPQPEVPLRGSTPPDTCAVDSCEYVSESRGWCHGHYLRWVRTGDVRADVPLGRRTQPEHCTVDGCGRRCHSKGLCKAHHKRRQATGSVQADVPIREVSGDGCISHGYRKVAIPWEDRHLFPGETQALEHRLVMARLSAASSTLMKTSTIATASVPTTVRRTLNCGRPPTREVSTWTTRWRSRSICSAAIDPTYSRTTNVRRRNRK